MVKFGLIQLNCINFDLMLFDFSLEIERLRIERYSIEIFPLILLLVIIEWFGRHQEFPILKDNKYQFKTIIVILLILPYT